VTAEALPATSTITAVLTDGVVKGAVYALVALGYTMVYGVLGMINFAHGEVFMIGMFACIYAIGVMSVAWGDHIFLNLALGAVVAMVFSAAYGYANERIAYRRLRKAHVLAPLTSAIGVSTFLQYFIFLTVSKQNVNFPRYYSDWLTNNHFGFGPTSFGGSAFRIELSYLQGTIIGLTLVIMAALFYFINATRMGIALRATAQDQLMAALVGIPVNRIIAFTFILGSALAAVAGVMVAMYDGVLGFDAGYRVGLKAFTAAILGGIGNVPGAVLGALILGVSEALTTYWYGSGWSDVTTFVVLMLVLLLRPRGLLGERVADKV
jgi:branched-chain amino acid transport system permease protein